MEKEFDKELILTHWIESSDRDFKTFIDYVLIALPRNGLIK